MTTSATGAHRQPAQTRSSPRRVVFYAFAALALFTIAARVVYLMRRGIIADEFQHLHAAFLVSSGETPYADFFAHHVPAVYYFLGNLLPLGSPSFDTIIDARYVALFANAVAVVVAFAWMRSTRGRSEALVVVVLFIGNFFLFENGATTYLDTYAAPLLLFSAWMLATSRDKPTRGFLSGAAMALGLLSSQKLFLVALVPLAWFVSRAVRAWDAPDARRSLGRDFLAFVLGGVGTALVLAILLGAEGISGLWRDAVALNLRWEARHRPTGELRFLMQTDGLVYVVAAIGATSQLVRLVRRRFSVEREDIASLFGAALALGLVVLPVVWGEYFVAAVPFALVVAAETLVSWWRRFVVPRLQRWVPEDLTTSQRRLAWVALAGAALLLLVAVWIRVDRPTTGRGQAATFVLAVAIALLLAGGMRLAPRALPVLVVVFLVLPSVAEQLAITERASNDFQRERVEYVMSETAADDPVFDGYSGYGVFRPHAYKYWFLHEEVRLILTEDELGPDIVDALRGEQPPIVIVDEHIEELPAEVLDYIDEHYEDTPFPEIKRRRAEETTG